jgi:hypothetical protein
MVSAPLFGQQAASQTVQRDTQAVAVLTQALNATGGATALGAIRDFVGSGTITYYWAGKEVQGTVTVKGRGTGQFRLDAALPNGVRSWVVSNGAGSLKEMDGTTTPVPYHNTVNLGSLTLPFAYLVTSLQDTSTSVSYVGLETKQGARVHHIRIRKVFPASSDPNGMNSKLTTRDFFIDPATFHVVSSLDMVHPKYRSNEDYPHEVQFSDYRQASGILVPFSITELGNGQRLSTIQLSQLTFNGGLTDSDFQQ